MEKTIQNYEFTPEELRELQLKNLEAALYFKEFCEKHNLLFYFCGGCCIGALRHKGFIPWDDDIDFFMPRKDYEKLADLWDKYADTERYSLVKPSNTVFTRNLFATINDNNTTFIKPHQTDLDINHGITLDILPLDGYPNSKFARLRQIFWALTYSLFCDQMIPTNHGKFVYFLGKIILFLIRSKDLRYKIWKSAEKHMTRYPIEECDNITELCSGPHYMMKKYPKKAFESAVYKEFEGYPMPIPVGYDEYLKTAFGDYMTLPPKEKQVGHHDVIFCDLHNSYKNYKGIHYCKTVFNCSTVKNCTEEKK